MPVIITFFHVANYWYELRLPVHALAGETSVGQHTFRVEFISANDDVKLNGGTSGIVSSSFLLKPMTIMLLFETRVVRHKLNFVIAFVAFVANIITKLQCTFKLLTALLGKMHCVERAGCTPVQGA